VLFTNAGRFVRGDFDTGADLTLLPVGMMAQLGIMDAECVPISIGPLGRAVEFGRLAKLAAKLDRQQFVLPAAFSDRSSVLFGRPGLVDQFRIELDPRYGFTCFTWTGPHEKTAGPWADYFVDRWQLLHSLGLSWARWEQAGQWLDEQGRPTLQKLPGGSRYTAPSQPEAETRP